MEEPRLKNEENLVPFSESDKNVLYMYRCRVIFYAT